MFANWMNPQSLPRRCHEQMFSTVRKTMFYCCETRSTSYDANLT